CRLCCIGRGGRGAVGAATTECCAVTKKRGGLGRGLGAPIPQTAPGEAPQTTEPQPQPLVPPQTADGPVATGAMESAPVAGMGTFEVPIESISPNPHQPRQGIEVDRLEELADSIREHGVLQPLVVTGLGDGTYALIAGERRWRAARLAGLEKVPVI